MGGAFNRTLWRSVGSVISTEGRSLNNLGKYGLIAWAPDINPFRDPRWGVCGSARREQPYCSLLLTVCVCVGGCDNYRPWFGALRAALLCLGAHFAGHIAVVPVCGGGGRGGGGCLLSPIVPPSPRTVTLCPPLPGACPLGPSCVFPLVPPPPARSPSPPPPPHTRSLVAQAGGRR